MYKYNREDSNKNFNTRQLLGTEIIVNTKIGHLKYTGILHEFFEMNNTIVLKNYTKLRLANSQENSHDVWEIADKGDIAIIKGDGWVEIEVPKWNQ